MSTIGYALSRLRNQLKSVKQDPFLTDRYLYGMLYKYGALYMRRQDSRDKLARFDNIWQSLPYIELIDVDKVEAECYGIKSNCKIKRSKLPLPELVQGYMGPLIRSVTSLDGSIKLDKTFPRTYTSIANSSNFKYNKSKYYWFMNNYLYTPSVDWDALRMEVVGNEDLSGWGCDTSKDCLYRQDQPCPFPDFLLAEIEAQVLKEYYGSIQLPEDSSPDKVNNLR